MYRRQSKKAVEIQKETEGGNTLVLVNLNNNSNNIIAIRYDKFAEFADILLNTHYNLGRFNAR